MSINEPIYSIKQIKGKNSVKILFWNLKNNPNEKWVSEIIHENDIDIALFAEYQRTSFKNVLSNLQNYIQYDGYGACE